MELETGIEIIQLYYSHHKSASSTLRAYKTMQQLNKDPFSVSSISRLVKRFESTGSVYDMPRSGRPSLVNIRAPVIEAELNLSLIHI